ncbi:redoxin domain-containing protein [Hymenobacter sp. 5516J-16]|uniref:Redoxin domain-containing protein n=1 Tax=Hymenobacter sublimis TaxID=2933777 RepID=A0ABY4J5T3_9BACT|nr:MULTISPECIES: redoxin domain-containing protein [Hymenobacter]UOQ78208.1 redoxin domain-containing protein [Hymenobacter sp. 5516J-16]UPL48188.1 redoxin domain-containing protein [Hymenobacter sublimis]
MSLRRLSILTAAALLFCTVAVGVARAQGSRSVADFSLKNSTNTEVALKSYAGSKAVVVVFVNPTCAFSKLYQSRLNSLNAEYSAKGVQFLFVNAPINLEASADTGDAEKLKIKTTGGADLPLLTDEGQKVSALLGATKTPEVVLLQPVGDGFAVRYKGAIDDNPQVEGYVREHYLAQALDNVLAGRAAGVPDKRAAGCLIKKF